MKGEDPARLPQYQQVLAMRQRKGKPGAMAAPGRDGLAAILRDPGMSTPGGRRDTAPPAVPCDGAARVSELCGITPRDLRSGDPAVVTPRGRGRKAGTVPLMHATAGLPRGCVSEAYPGLGPRDLDKPLFPNPRGDHPARAGVADILARHADGARKSGADIPEGVSPHSFRHQRATGLPGSGREPRPHEGSSRPQERHDHRDLRDRGHGEEARTAGEGRNGTQGRGIPRPDSRQRPHGLAQGPLLIWGYAKGRGCRERMTCGGSPFPDIIRFSA
ncbi:hypothetical protein ADJ70_01175 [Olsenella sp. oral taxon 807]|nr:hypothetical protein ADJ70_01175 [Olsenella sp. oral taxon 807]